MASMRARKPEKGETQALQDFFTACENGNLTDMQAAYEKHGDFIDRRINHPAKGFANPPLLLAVERGYIEIVDYLLSLPTVNPLVVDDVQMDARSVAIDSPNPLGMVSHLLNHARFRDLDIDENVGCMTPLGSALSRGHYDVAKLLLERGADVRRMIGQEGTRETPLHCAAHSGSLECVKLILKAGLLPDTPDEDNQTPLFKAIKSGHFAVVRHLVEEEAVDVNWTDNVGVVPRDLAESCGMHQIAIYLARKGASSRLAIFRKTRDFVAQWQRIWVQGDLPSGMNHANIHRFGDHIYLTPGFQVDEYDVDLDYSSCLRFHADDIHQTTLKPLLKPHLRPHGLSFTAKGSFLSVLRESPTSSAASTGPVLVDNPETDGNFPADAPYIVRCNPSSGMEQRPHCILFDKPYKPNTTDMVCYFEVKIRKLGPAGVVAIGLAPKDFPVDNNLPGWTEGSYAYHSDDGTHFVRKMAPVPWGPPGHEGDTLGIGFHWGQEKIFFSHNGVFLGFVTPRPYKRRPLFGCIGLIGVDTEAEIIFGHHPFVKDAILKNPSMPEPSDGTLDATSLHHSSTLSSTSNLATANPFLFNFEVPTVHMQRVAPLIEMPSDKKSMQLTLPYEFRRNSVPYGPYIIQIDPETRGQVVDTTNGKLYYLEYATRAPFMSQDFHEEQGDLLHTLMIEGQKIVTIDVRPSMSLGGYDPDYQLSERLNYVLLMFLDLKTMVWSMAQVDLRHLCKKRVLIDVATASVPYADGKLWFLSSPNCPFYIDLQTYRAYAIDEQRAPNAKNLWQCGASFAKIPSHNAILAEIASSEVQSHHKTSIPTSQAQLAHSISQTPSDEDLKTFEKFLTPWNGVLDLRNRLLPENVTATAPYHIIETKNGALAEEDEQNEDRTENDATSGALVDPPTEQYDRDQFIVFGGLLKDDRSAATRTGARDANRGENDDDMPDNEGTAIFNSEIAFFDPYSATWTMPRVRGFTPTPKGMSAMHYLNRGRILNFGGNFGNVALDELELLTLSASFSTDDKLAIYYNNAQFSDFKISFPSSPSIYTHKAILISRSKMFRDMLMAPTGAAMSSIELPEAHYKFFRFVLRYFYSDTLPQVELEPQEYLLFLDFAEKYAMEHVPRLCEMLLLNHLTDKSKSLFSALGPLLFDSGHFADANVIIDGQAIACHRVVVCSRSEYFKALFTGSMMEGQLGVAELEIGISHRVGVQLIRYLYTLELDYESMEDIVVDMLIGAQALSLHELVKLIENVVVVSLALDNVDYLLEVAKDHHLTRLENECNNFKEEALRNPKAQDQEGNDSDEEAKRAHTPPSKRRAQAQAANKIDSEGFLKNVQETLAAFLNENREVVDARQAQAAQAALAQLNEVADLAGLHDPFDIDMMEAEVDGELENASDEEEEEQEEEQEEEESDDALPSPPTRHKRKREE